LLDSLPEALSLPFVGCMDNAKTSYHRLSWFELASLYGDTTKLEKFFSA